MFQRHSAENARRLSATTILFSFLLIIPLLRCSHDDQNPVSSESMSRLLNKTALFIVGSTKTMTTGDAAIKSDLTAYGLKVTGKSDDSISGKDTGYSIIIISGSCNPFNVGSMFKSQGKPVVCMHAGLFPSMAMTGGTSGTDFGYVTGSSITIPDSAPVMADKLKGSVTVTSGSDSLGWGLPNANADTIANIGSGKYAIFGYNKAKSMFGGFTAPSRRVGFFMGNQAAGDASANGVSLFGRAVAWALNLNDLNNAPVVALLAPKTHSKYLLCDSIVLTATASDADGVVKLVRFTCNDTAFDSAAASPYRVVLKNFTVAKTCAFRAIAIDDSNSVGQSAICSVTVRHVVPRVSITTPVVNTLYKLFDTVTVTAKVIDSDKTLDSVFFYDSSAASTTWAKLDSLGANDTVSKGLYAIKYAHLSAGVYKVKASTKDILDSTRTSAAITFQVRNRVPSIRITYPVAKTLFKMFDTLHVTVKCYDSNKTLDTIIFYDSIGGTWTGFDTLTAKDSVKGGLYTTKKIDTLKTLGTHFLKAKVWDIYDSTRTSSLVSINVRNRVPSIAMTYPTAGKLFAMYDTLHVTVKCVDSNKTLDTIIFYDSIGGVCRGFDTLTAADSAKGGLYTTKKIDSLKTLGTHYLKATVWDKYDSIRTSKIVSISVRNRVPSIAITYPTASKVFSMFDTLHVTVKCFDSNKTLDTIIFYDSIGGVCRGFDTLTAADSAKGGLYTTKKIDSLKTLGTHYLKATVWDKYDSIRTSKIVSISVRNRVPSIAITYPTASKVFSMYDTLRVTVKCFDSNKTLDTIIFYDSTGGVCRGFDTLTAADSAKGGLYTTKKIDSLKTLGTHYLKATVWDKYDSTRTSKIVSISVRNRVPSIAITYPAANTVFKMYDTLHVTVKCSDSNKTLDTVIFYDSLAGASWVGIDTLTAKDSAKGGLYTTKKIDSLKAQGNHYLKAKVWDKYDSTRTSAIVAISVRNRVPSIGITYPTANTLFKMYDTLHISVKCFDSNKTLDTVIFYDSLAGASWVGIDTLTAKDSAKGGLYTTKKIDSLKAQGNHYLKAKVWDIYDSTRTSAIVPITVRNRVPSVVITSPVANTEFKNYDTIKVTAKIVDSNQTLDTIIFYDSLAGATWKAFDTLTVADSATGGKYTSKKYDTLSPGGSHFLKVVVRDKYDSTRTSVLVKVVHKPPTAVTLNTPTDSTSSSLTLVWTANSDEGFASYKIYYATSAGIDTSKTMFGPITNKNVTSIALSGLSSNTDYYVKIMVFDLAGQYAASNEVHGKTTP